MTERLSALRSIKADDKINMQTIFFLWSDPTQ